MFDLDTLPVLTESGHFVSEVHMRIAEVIREYDRNLELEWIPEGQRTTRDPAFRVVHTDPRSGYRYTVCYTDTLDGRLLERIIKMDAAKQGNILDDLDARNKAVKLLMKKEHDDKLAEAHDMAHHALRSHKNTYTIKDGDKLITIRDFGNRER